LSTRYKKPQRYRGKQGLTRVSRVERRWWHDLVGGRGQLGEAVGQAGAGQDEVVGFEDFGLAEFGRQVQVLENVLRPLFLVGIRFGHERTCSTHDRGKRYEYIGALSRCSLIATPIFYAKFRQKLRPKRRPGFTP